MTTPSMVQCPKCSAQNPHDNRFCGSCGQTLSSHSQMPTVEDPAAESPKARGDSQRPSCFGNRGGDPVPHNCGHIPSGWWFALDTLCSARAIYSKESTSRFPRADAAFSNWRRVGQCLGSSKRWADGHEVSSARASSDSGRAPRSVRTRMAA
jgi:hypothetical protein